ncbi:AraC family transcriptional regulator ligand-binding domain-containing protein [Marinobacterium jannaschii]|uniref:AraC family transcriptional regulator ligand-binding domain-containing protein n=1 Tax=Marinobacterium jannaschii TaxID=64970 RepID=UPI00048466A9|nr:AraC family transcriptional regulator ligand-binding domain-containing protein [Marinobacterium jannaschii]
MPDSTVLAKLLEPILEVARHQRLDPQELLQNAGLTLETLNQPGARISSQTHNDLLATLAERLGNPRIALRIGEATQPRMLGSVGFLMTTATDLNSSFQLLADYMPILLEGAHLDYRETPSGRILRLELSQSLPFTEEWLLACLYNWPRWLSGKQIPAVSVSLLQSEPDKSHVWQQFFAAEVRFDAPANQIILPSRYLEYPCLDANEEMHQLHREFADTLLSHSSEESALIARIRSQIRLQLANGEGQVRREQIAGLLNMSLRTMQRKLGTLNSSFQQLLDQTRKEATLQEIRKGKLSFGEISYRMGFSNPSAFQKAFKRWQGMPPTEYRRQLSASAEPVQPADKETALDNLPALSLSEFYPLALQLVASSRLWPLQAACTTPAMLKLSRHQEQFRIRRDNSPEKNHLDRLRYQAPEYDFSSLRPQLGSNAARLYNLGTLLFRLLSSSDAFDQPDIGAILDAKQHPDRVPLPRHLPDHLAALIIRLLAADTQTRYHSDAALTADLMRSQQLWQQKTDPQQYPPDPDLPSQIELNSAILWQTPLAELSPLIAQTQDFQHIAICGGSGSGKTAFLNYLQQQLCHHAIVLYADASIDAEHPLPVQIFSPLIHRMYRAPAHWQQRLRQHLSYPLQLGRQLSGLSSLYGESTTSDAAPALKESQWLQSYRELLQACGDQTVVLMLDNCDQLSPFGQSLIHDLLSRPLSQPLLLITTASHPDTSPGNEIHWLQPLTPAQISQLVAASLAMENRPASDSVVLAALLSRKTDGSLAQISQLLSELQQGGALSYRSDQAQWRYNDDQSPVVADSALGPLYSDTLLQLHSISRELLNIAAVIDAPFSLDQVADLMADPLARMEIHLWPLLQSNILVRCEGQPQRFSFSHPQLASFIYRNIPAQHRCQLHLHIGLSLIPQGGADDEPLSSAHLSHLAHCPHLLPPDQRQLFAAQCRDLASLALQQDDAGRGLQLTQHGLKLQTSASDGLNFELQILHWQSLWALKRQDAAVAVYRKLKRSQRLPQQQQLLLYHRARQLSESGQQADALKLLNQALTLLGAPIPDDNTALRLQLADQWSRLELAPGDDADSGEEPHRALLELYAQVAELRGFPLHQACAITRPGLPAMSETAQRPWDAVTFAGLSFVSSWLIEDPGSAQRYARQALERAERLPDCGHKARALLICGSRTCHWYQDHAHAAQLVQQATDIALNSREWALAGQAIVIGVNQQLFADQPLPDSKALEAGPLEQLRQLQLPHQVARLKNSALWLVQQLAGNQKSAAPWQLPAADSSDSWHMLARSCSALLMDNRAEWDRCLRHETQLENQLAGQQAVALMQLFTTLMRLDRLRSPHTGHHPLLRHEVQRQSARFELWAERNPANFGAMWLLIRAESASLGERPAEAIECYEQALQGASGLMLQALISERYGKYSVALKRPAAGNLLIRQAITLYRQWSAEAKAAQLEQWLSRFAH